MSLAMVLHLSVLLMFDADEYNAQVSVFGATTPVFLMAPFFDT